MIPILETCFYKTNNSIFIFSNTSFNFINAPSQAGSVNLRLPLVRHTYCMDAKPSAQMHAGLLLQGTITPQCTSADQLGVPCQWVVLFQLRPLTQTLLLTWPIYKASEHTQGSMSSGLQHWTKGISAHRTVILVDFDEVLDLNIFKSIFYWKREGGWTPPKRL